jgi:hypothetical protein
MKLANHNPFSEHYISDSSVMLIFRGKPMPQNDIQVLISRDLEYDLVQWVGPDYARIGTAEFVARGSQGIGEEARLQAALVGASVVLFQTTPAKLRAIRRRPDGSIDLSSVLAKLTRQRRYHRAVITSYGRCFSPQFRVAKSR